MLQLHNAFNAVRDATQMAMTVQRVRFTYMF